MASTPNPLVIDVRTGKVYRELGYTNGRGYRQVQVEGRDWLVHRLVWETAHGPIARGMTINHINGDKVDNRLENLECVTQAENNWHAREVLGHDPAKGRRLRGEDHWASQLTDEQVREIRERSTGRRGEASEMAREFRVSKSTVSRILRGEAWAHVDAV